MPLRFELLRQASFNFLQDKKVFSPGRLTLAACYPSYSKHNSRYPLVLVDPSSISLTATLFFSSLFFPLNLGSNPGRANSLSISLSLY